ncbi:peptidoglycan-binding domain-containing protein [Actinomadura macra]|uniref:peptidoglycan-binding domain-containing protein n=1 Tax=Actinomadura macra TaxID=46164 RepID=UPI000A0332BC|nr:peptidoglycan-binding domain-containing protein [Actinomadura macra]
MAEPEVTSAKTTAPPWPGRYLKQPPPMEGKNNDVRTWQTQMHKRGWKIKVDNWYGPKSEAVCVAFQKEKRLKVDGVVGPETWKCTWECPIT